jgi:DNA-binding response OmpR family regulator
LRRSSAAIAVGNAGGDETSAAHDRRTLRLGWAPKAKASVALTSTDLQSVRGTAVLVGLDQSTFVSVRNSRDWPGVSLVWASGGFDLIQSYGQMDADVIVLYDPLPDIEMLTLLKQIQRSRSMSRSSIVLASRQATDSQTHDALFEAGVDKILPQPVDVETLATSIEDLLKTRRSADLGKDEPDLAGNLEVISIVEILQLCNAGKKSGSLMCSTRRGRANLNIRGGEIIYASFGPTQGTEAVYSLLRERVGHFQLKLGVFPGEPNINQAFPMLMLEGMRRSDENRRNVSARLLSSSHPAPTERPPTG